MAVQTCSSRGKLPGGERVRVCDAFSRATCHACVHRKGSACQTLEMLGKYCVGNEMSAQLMSYVKVSSRRWARASPSSLIAIPSRVAVCAALGEQVRALVIEPDEDESNCNVDGEVLTGRGPVKIEVAPALINFCSPRAQ